SDPGDSWRAVHAGESGCLVRGNRSGNRAYVNMNQYQSPIWELCAGLASSSAVAGLTIGGSIENGDRTGPACRPGPHLDRKAAHLEALGRQLFEIVQFLEMAIADLAAGLVAFPDKARIAGLGEF